MCYVLFVLYFFVLMTPNGGICSRDGTFNMIRVLSNRKKGLRVCHINAQSLTRKIDEFRYLFENLNVDVVCVSETWFSPCHNDHLFHVNGYRLFRLDRVGHGGGVAIYVRNGLSCKFNCASPPSSTTEYLFLEIFTKFDKVLIGCVYRPNRQICYNGFIDFLENLTIGHNKIIITGDFNSDILKDTKFSLHIKIWDSAL